MFFSLKSTLTTCLEHREGIYKEGLGGGEVTLECTLNVQCEAPFFPTVRAQKGIRNTKEQRGYEEEEEEER